MNSAGPLEGASPARVTALTVRFLLELALLVGVAVVAWQAAPGGWRWVAVVLAPVVVAIVWGLFLSPRARYALPDVARLAIEAVLFLGTGAGLLVLGLGVAALVGVVCWIVDRVALAVLRS